MCLWKLTPVFFIHNMGVYFFLNLSLKRETEFISQRGKSHTENHKKYCYNQNLIMLFSLILFFSKTIKKNKTLLFKMSTECLYDHYGVKWFQITNPINIWTIFMQNIALSFVILFYFSKYIIPLSKYYLNIWINLPYYKWLFLPPLFRIIVALKRTQNYKSFQK